jgi:SAM-dependent methyltransferase
VCTPDPAAFYDRVAIGYQRWWLPVIEPPSLRLLDLVAPVVSERPEAVIVDLGAGTGPLARAAVTRWPGVTAIAVDPSRGMLETGRGEAARTLAREAQGRINWQPGTAEALPLADRSTDVVVSSFTWHYLRNWSAVLREIQRVSRPAAAVAIVSWLVNDWTFRPWVILDEVLQELAIERPPPRIRLRGIQSPTAAAVLMRRGGFEAVHATIGIVEYAWRVDALVHCAQDSEERRLFDSLEPATARRLAARWRKRLQALSSAELTFRDQVAYVSARQRAA